MLQMLAQAVDLRSSATDLVRCAEFVWVLGVGQVSCAFGLRRAQVPT